MNGPIIVLQKRMYACMNGFTDQQCVDQNGPTDQQCADQNGPTNLISVECIIAFPHLVDDQNDPTTKPKWHHR